MLVVLPNANPPGEGFCVAVEYRLSLFSILEGGPCKKSKVFMDIVIYCSGPFKCWVSNNCLSQLMAGGRSRSELKTDGSEISIGLVCTFRILYAYMRQLYHK